MTLKTIVKGKVTGKVLKSSQPINFLGSVDKKTGEVTDQKHDLFGKKIAGSILVFPNSACFWSVIVPVFLSTEPRKLIGWLDLRTLPVTVPFTIVSRVNLSHPSLALIMALGLHPNRLSISDNMRP